MLRDRNILLRSTAVTPEIKGSTRALVLRRGGRTDRGLAPGVDRVKSAGVMQIHRPLPLSFGWMGWFRRRFPIYGPSERRVRQVVWALWLPAMCCAAPAKRMKGSSQELFPPAAYVVVGLIKLAKLRFLVLLLSKLILCLLLSRLLARGKATKFSSWDRGGVEQPRNFFSLAGSRWCHLNGK